MPEAHVRRIDSTVRAVHTTDDDWRDVLRSWFETMGADEERIHAALADISAAVEQEDPKPWLVLQPEGVAFIHPADFVNHFEDVNATDVLDEIWQKRRAHPERGYTAAHDDVHGLGHLLSEGVSRLSHFGETPTDEAIRGEILIAASLLVAAVDLIDRGESKQRELPTFYTLADMQRYEQQWLKRVGDYLAALDDLQGQSQDEDATEPAEVIGWAREQFTQIFHVSGD